MKKSFYFTLLFILSPLSAYASSGVSGFAWIGNNSQLGPDLENPSALAIKMSGLSFDGKNISGEADIGLAKDDFILGNQDDPLANGNPLKIGEVKFGETIPPDDCFSAGDCHPVSWFQKVNSSNPKEGYLSGWAKMEIGDPGKYPEVWVHFKAPTDSANYDCSDASSKRDENYYVCSDKEGKTFGYAWSSGGKSTSLADNPGLGWIDFSEVSIFADSSQAQTGDPTQNISNTMASRKAIVRKNCKVYFADSVQNEKVLCKKDSKVTYKAWADFEDIKNYTWQCGDNKPETTKLAFHECTGEEIPKLTIVSLVRNKKTKCEITTKLSVDENPTCEIEGRIVDSKNIFSSKIKMLLGEKIEVRIQGRCLEETSTAWSHSNLNLVKSDNLNSEFETQSVGEAKVGAKIKTLKGDEIDCGEVNVDVKEKITWSN